MINEEARAELEWVYQNGFENDLSIIGTDKILDSIRMGIEALEKQTCMKPVKKRFNVGYRFIRVQEYYTCPACGALVEVDDNEGYMSEYYPACRCGQLIDWNGIIDICDMKWLEEYEEMM